MHEPTTATRHLRPADRALLGLEPDPDDPTALTLTIEPHLCRTDGRFYGGAALAAALAAGEAVTGRTALWSSTQLVSVADLGERIRVAVEVVASGRTVDQVQVRGTIDDRLIFAAVGATATARDDGMSGLAVTMPTVPPPEACAPMWSPDAGPSNGATPAGAPVDREVGHHLVSEHRAAPLLDESARRPGHRAMWARLAGPAVTDPPELTPAGIGFVADMVPLAIARACGVEGAGTSLDNSLRIGEPADAEWALLELDAHVAVGGFGHGLVHAWSPDGRLLATGTQTARLFSFEDFASRSAR